MKKSAFRRRGALCLCLSFAFFLPCLAGCGKALDNRKKAVTLYDCFDTVATVTFYGRVGKKDFERYESAVNEVLHEYHKLTDIYHEYEGMNNLATVNKNAGNATAVDGKLLDFLAFCKECHTLTGGYTNVAMGAVTSLWHDFREGRENGEDTPLPTDAALAQAATHTNIDDVLLDFEAGTVTLCDGEMSLDVGAVAKGYATERLVEKLTALGAASVAMNIGGSVRVIGKKPSGGDFLTAVRNPSGDGYACLLTLADLGTVTSGDYERYVTVDGVRYAHIIDKNTLYPATGFASVTVLTDDLARGDALSTALFCMTEEAGRALLQTANAEGIFIYRDGTVSYTDGARARLTED